MVIFYDVDGTLAMPFQSPPPLVRNLLSSLEAAGISQVLCSGKNHEYLAGLARGLGLTGSTWLIAENGAVIFNWLTLELTRLGEPAEYLPALREALRREALPPEEYYEEPKLNSLTFIPVGRQVQRTREVAAHVHEIVERHAPEAQLHFHPDGGIDIVPAGVDKGSAARRVLELLGVAADTAVTCGDGRNDLPLLALGYPLTVRDAAPEVVGFVRERGGHVADEPGPEGLVAGLARLIAADWLDLDPGSLSVAYRPWGVWEVLARGEGFKVKRMVVAPGHRLSLQKHAHRVEHWFVFGGEAHVTCGGETRHLAESQTVTIPVGEAHRIENRGETDLVIIEIQLGSYLEEDDIVRLQDDYRR